MSQAVTQNTSQMMAQVPFDVELRNVFKFFNKEPAVHGIDLEVRQGEFFSILGPSGCGKTTTLRLIGGFETADAGKVVICGETMTNTPPYRRPVNTVFQSYALFKHLNVGENIAFGLRLQKLPKVEIEKRVKEVLAKVKLEGLRSRFPHQLSGGQQQRVALARALVNQPTVMLLDEPLGALDLKLRKEMQLELSTLQKELGMTFVMVTHDQDEALSMSDRIAVMNRGKIEQVGTPSEIYERPHTAFVAQFIGDTNLLTGDIVGVDSNLIQVLTKGGLKLTVTRNGDTPSELGKNISVSIRPEKVQLSLYKPSIPTNCFEGKVINTMYMGTHVNYVIELANQTHITAMQPNTVGILPDSDTPIYAFWLEGDCLAFS
ncbi:ABC transporter ATP-binding protein [Calothrix sp. NIES-3974]|uniref:ABC transporter ATP-binding protein n=1 Tax=Calothrix sp. NIES-3974 TaxID=2005462 RepID=UPI000B5E60C1|nr:ABC transporter ATP-binding protein [Calothrix sp. NIES-3974]BAZ04265.1 spermidine/putrescine ABC transporter ATPase subunit [Calothrix sp. NIES-3974]